jgi:hypothetical protein
MSEIDTDGLVRLAMWGKNMTTIRDGRMEWPGFSYRDDEWQRLRALSATVSNSFRQVHSGQRAGIPGDRRDRHCGDIPAACDRAVSGPGRD